MSGSGEELGRQGGRASLRVSDGPVNITFNLNSAAGAVEIAVKPGMHLHCSSAAKDLKTISVMETDSQEIACVQ